MEKSTNPNSINEWARIVDELAPLRPDMLNDSMVKLNVATGTGHGATERRQVVIVARDRIEPDLDMLVLRSAFATNRDVSSQALLEQFGGLMIASVAFHRTGSDTGEGILALETNIPLSCFCLTDPVQFHIYLTAFAQAADQVEQAIWGETIDQY